MVKKFLDRATERFWRDGVNPGVPAAVVRKALRQLDLVVQAQNLLDMDVFPGNRFKKLTGSDPPRYSIRINDQYRVTFEWRDGAAWNIKLEDYH